MGHVAPEVASIRQRDVGDLQHSGSHHLHPVVEQQRLVVLEPHDRGWRRGREPALEDGRLAEEQGQADGFGVESRQS